MFSIPHFIICVICGYKLYKIYEQRNPPMPRPKTTYIVLQKSTNGIINKLVFDSKNEATRYFYSMASRDPYHYAMAIVNKNGEVEQTYNVSKEEATAHVGC